MLYSTCLHLQLAHKISCPCSSFCLQDLPHDIFWEKPYEYAWYNTKNKGLYGQKKQKATNFFKMLKTDESDKPMGKIYVIYYGSDSALAASYLANNEARIGSVGHKKDGEGEGKVRADLKDYIEDYDVDESWFTGDDEAFKHSYQLEPAAIKFYFSKDVGKPEE